MAWLIGGKKFDLRSATVHWYLDAVYVLTRDIPERYFHVVIDYGGNYNFQGMSQISVVSCLSAKKSRLPEPASNNSKCSYDKQEDE